MVYGEIYPLSVRQGYQKGDILKTGSCELIRHYCGFGFLYGTPGEDEFEELYAKVQDTYRTILLTDDNYIVDFYKEKGIPTGTRSFFEYRRREVQVPGIPEGFELHPMDEDILESIEGRIKPDFSWDDSKEFLSKGTGFVITKDNEPAAWAFSAAVSDTEIDIGVETSEKYRGKGLSTTVAAVMTEHILKLGKKPVWACDIRNIASSRVALKTGFEKIGECTTIMLKV